MRFGVVGVKVWFQVKKRKPYFYRFSFLLLCIGLLTHTLGERVKKQKNATFLITQNSKNCIIIKKRGMLTRTSNYNTAFKFTSGLKSSVLIANPSKNMSTAMRGTWDPDSTFGKQVTSEKGITHETIIDLRVFKYRGLKQLNNAVTSNPNCYKHDKGVIAVTFFAERLLDGSKVKKSEHVAWHAEYFTLEDVRRHFRGKMPSTLENDKNLNKTLLFIEMPSFIRYGYDVKLKYICEIDTLPEIIFKTPASYKEGIFLSELLKKQKLLGVEIPTKSFATNTKPFAITAPQKPLQITAPEKPLQITAPEKLLQITAPPQTVIYLPSELSATSVLFVTTEEKVLELVVDVIPNLNTPVRSEIYDEKDHILKYAVRTIIKNNNNNNNKELKNSNSNADDNNQN